MESHRWRDMFREDTGLLGNAPGSNSFKQRVVRGRAFRPVVIFPFSGRAVPFRCKNENGMEFRTARFFPSVYQKGDKTTHCARIIIIRQQSPFSKTKKSPASSSQALFVSAILSALCAPLLLRFLRALRFSIHPISEGLQINREIFLHVVFQLINELVGHDGCVGAIAYGCGHLTDTGVSHVTGGKHPGNIGFPVLIDLNVTPIV